MLAPVWGLMSYCVGLVQRLAELQEGRARPKRKMPSLSINNPMEVLRQRLLLEVARKQMREANQRQAVANRLFLQNVGKRGTLPNYTIRSGHNRCKLYPEKTILIFNPSYEISVDQVLSQSFQLFFA